MSGQSEKRRHEADGARAQRPLRVLFLCTGNSARSIMAEALLDACGAGRFLAYSAGSRPRGEVHPLALETLRANGLRTEGLRSKSWEEFARPDAPEMDIVVTVCDSASGESCPLWPGRPLRAHWSVPDPAAVEGSEDAKRRAFAAAFEELRARISRLAGLGLQELDRRALESELERIGRSGR